MMIPRTAARLVSPRHIETILKELITLADRMPSESVPLFSANESCAAISSTGC